MEKSPSVLAQHIPPGLARWWSLSRAEKISLPDSDHAQPRVFDVHSDHSIWSSSQKKLNRPIYGKIFLGDCKAIGSSGCSRLRSRRRAIVPRHDNYHHSAACCGAEAE